MVGQPASELSIRRSVADAARRRSWIFVEPVVGALGLIALGCGIVGMALAAAVTGLLAAALAWFSFRYALLSTSRVLVSLAERDWDGATAVAVQSGIPEINRAVVAVSESARYRDQALQEAIHRERMKALDLELRSAELEDAQTHLEHANQDLEAFTYSASHDLGTPARMITSLAELLADEVDNEGEAAEYLAGIRRTSLRMEALIRDLLVVSRLRGDDENLSSTVALADLVGEIMAEIKGELAPQARVIVAGELPTVTVPPERVQQVLQNLVRNGFKFNDSEDPTVTVEGWGEADMVVLRVTDNGIGLPKGDPEEAFGLFRRLHGNDRFEGTGAGLAIARRAARSLGGELWVEKTSEMGTTFAFAFPSYYRPESSALGQ